MDGRVDLMARERRLVREGGVVVGLDEVGRGALAGPVCVGAVVVVGPADPPVGLTDSKLLSARVREDLVGPIGEWSQDASLGWASAEEVDAWGIRLALAAAATRAIEALEVVPSHALVDGPHSLLRSTGTPTPGALEPPSLIFSELATTTIVHGDRTCATVAAASVLAKVARDRVMVDLDPSWPDYGWAANKGYGTPAHLRALDRLGPTPWHRLSWRLRGWDPAAAESRR